MKLILWAAAEAEVITAEEADVAAEEDFMMGVDKEAYMAEEAGQTWDIDCPDSMPEWYSVTMAHRYRFIFPMTLQPTSDLGYQRRKVSGSEKKGNGTRSHVGMTIGQ